VLARKGVEEVFITSIAEELQRNFIPVTEIQQSD